MDQSSVTSANLKITRWRPSNTKTILAKYASKCYWCGEMVKKGKIAEWYMDEKMIVHAKCHLDAYTK